MMMIAIALSPASIAGFRSESSDQPGSSDVPLQDPISEFT